MLDRSTYAHVTWASIAFNPVTAFHIDFQTFKFQKTLLSKQFRHSHVKTVRNGLLSQSSAVWCGNVDEAAAV